MANLVDGIQQRAAEAAQRAVENLQRILQQREQAAQQQAVQQQQIQTLNQQPGLTAESPGGTVTPATFAAIPEVGATRPPAVQNVVQTEVQAGSPVENAGLYNFSGTGTVVPVNGTADVPAEVTVPAEAGDPADSDFAALQQQAANTGDLSESELNTLHEELLAIRADVEAGRIEAPPGLEGAISNVEFAIGRRMSDQVNDPAITYSPEELQAFEAQLSRYENNPSVMTAFYSGVEPEALLDFMAELTQYGKEGYGIDTTLQRNVLDSLQTGLETASRQWSPAYAAGYARDLVDAAAHPANAHTARDVTGALSYLLYDSNYSDSFLTAAADALDHFERVEVDGRPGTWGDRVGNSNLWQFFPPEATTAAYDPMVSMMSALGNNPEVALNFFYGGENNGVDRQMYWIHDRGWSHDQFLHMSEALVAATTDLSIIDPPTGDNAARAAQLASSAVNLLGHRDGIGFYDAGMFGTDMERSAAASENFATILATYMHGVDESLMADRPYLPAWDSSVATDIRAGYYDGMIVNTPLFNHDSLRNFIVYAAGNEDGLLTLRAGLNDYTANKYALAAEYLQEHGITNDTAQAIFEQAYLSQARMEGAFVDAIGDASIARAAGKDKVREQWVALGQGVIGMVPVGKLVTKAGGDEVAKTLITFAVNRGVTAGASELKQRWANLEAAERATQNGNAYDTMALAQYNVFVALNQAGLVPEAALDGPWAVDGQLIPYEDFLELSPADQVRALSWLRNAEDGVGVIFNQFDFQGEFLDQFEEPFEN